MVPFHFSLPPFSLSHSHPFPFIPIRFALTCFHFFLLFPSQLSSRFSFHLSLSLSFARFLSLFLRLLSPCAFALFIHLLLSPSLPPSFTVAPFIRLPPFFLHFRLTSFLFIYLSFAFLLFFHLFSLSLFHEPFLSPLSANFLSLFPFTAPVTFPFAPFLPLST